MNKQPLISVIIVVFNSSKYIYTCINSIKRSAKYANIAIEIIVIVNDKYKYIIPSSKVIYNSHNVGFSKGANQGAKIAKGDWLLFANPDTYTYKSTINRLLRFIHQENVAVIAPKILKADGTVQHTIVNDFDIKGLILEQSYLKKIILSVIYKYKLSINKIDKSAQVFAVEGTYFMVRAKSFKEIGGLDERFFMYFEDMDLCKRVTKIRQTIFFEPKSVVTHYGHQSNQGALNGIVYLDSINKYINKYHSKIYSFLFIIILIFGICIRLISWIIYGLVNCIESKQAYIHNKCLFCKDVLVHFPKVIRSCYLT